MHRKNIYANIFERLTSAIYDFIYEIKKKTS